MMLIIQEHGEKLLCLFYNIKGNNSLDSLRYVVFQRKVATATKFISPESLPPTSDAALYHSYRAYHQTQVWLGNTKDPLNWGYYIRQNMMLPIKMKQPPAPSSLLKVFRCGCSTGCKTMVCSCRKHSLKCTDSCRECSGTPLL